MVSQVLKQTGRAIIKLSKHQIFIQEVDLIPKVRFRPNLTPNLLLTETASKKFYRETKQQRFLRTSMG